MRVTNLRLKFPLIVRKRVVAAGFPPRVHRRCGVRGGDLVHKWWKVGTAAIAMALGPRCMSFAAPCHARCRTSPGSLACVGVKLGDRGVKAMGVPPSTLRAW